MGKGRWVGGPPCEILNTPLTTRSRVFILLFPWLLTFLGHCIIQSFYHSSPFLFNLTWSRRLLFPLQWLWLRLHVFFLNSFLVRGTCKDFSLLRFLLASLGLFTFGVWGYIENMHSLFSRLRSGRIPAIVVVCSWKANFNTWRCDCRHGYRKFRMICSTSDGTWWRNSRRWWTNAGSWWISWHTQRIKL